MSDSQQVNIDEIVTALEFGERQHRLYSQGKKLADGLRALRNTETERRAAVAKLGEEIVTAQAELAGVKADATMARDIATSDSITLKANHDRLSAEQQKARDDIRAEIESAQEELAAINSQLDAARAAVRKITETVQ